MIDSVQSTHTTESEAPIAAKTGTVLVSGSTGLVGQALVRRLASRGQATQRLVRSAPSQGQLLWDPAGGAIDASSIAADAVVHLAGENIAAGRWTAAKMEAIRESRVQGTRLLAETLAQLPKPPSVLVSASAIGYYGDGGDELLTECSPAGAGFLPEVCQAWEDATAPAREAGIRVVNLRIGVVLAKSGGALQKMLLPFKLGAGGRIGNGKQFMSWILLDDLVSAICAVLDDESFAGPVNATAPHPVTNSEFTEALGKLLHRPTFATMPAFAARIALGKMADDLLLASLRVSPRELLERGFEFSQPRIDGALQAALEPGL